jgi:triacylglycerol lipase
VPRAARGSIIAIATPVLPRRVAHALVLAAVLAAVAGGAEAQRVEGRARRVSAPARSRVRPVRPRPRRALSLHPRRSWKARGEIRDVTDRFADAYRRASAGAPVLPAEAADLVYLVVPGAMGQQVPRYMAKTQRHLESLGLEVHRSRINTAAGVADNAATLRREILALARGRRSVVLVTHSKGGVDALAADALYREIRPLVRARVLMQPPWDGTPLADMMDSRVSRFALRLIGGSAALVADLQSSARQRFTLAHPTSHAIPTVTLATSQSGWSALTPVAAILRRRGAGDSDGVVPKRSQEVPGSHVVRLDRLDHWSTVLEVPGSAYRPGPLAEALIAIALTIR